MGRAVLADGQTGVAADHLDIQSGIADIVADLVIDPAGREDREGMHERSGTACREAGADVHHVGFRDSDIVEPLRILFRKVHAHGAGFEIRVKYIDIAASAELGKSAAIGNTC